MCKTCVYLGVNILPPDGTRLTFLPGSTVKLQSTYNCSAFCDPRWLYAYRKRRTWYFTSSDCGHEERLARIYHDFKPVIYNSSLPDVAVEKPATLILKNVDLKYNGTYVLRIRRRFFSLAEILVFIAGKCYFPVIQLNLRYIFNDQIIQIKIMYYFKFVVQSCCIGGSCEGHFVEFTRSSPDFVHS